MRILREPERVHLERSSICTIGAFDGVHLGHQHLIRSTLQDAHARGALATVVTFFPHPRIVLGKSPNHYLTLPDEKTAIMRELGVDVLVVYPFTESTIHTSAEQFVDWMCTHLNMQGLWVGADFALGYRRRGDVAFLRRAGQQKGFTVNVLQPLTIGLQRISSTRIRDALARGDIRDANLCLGRPFRVQAYYNSHHQLRVDERQWMPAPGVYPVLIESYATQVHLTSDAPRIMYLEHPLPLAPHHVRVTFI
ncbi:MAG: hypothetical protein ACK4WM_03925 [Thermoflexales bacterium]